MDCKMFKEKIYARVDAALGSLEKSDWEAHRLRCASCDKAAQFAEAFSGVLQEKRSEKISVSPNFEKGFWGKVEAAQQKNPIRQFLEDLQSHLVFPAPVSAMAILLTAFLVGGSAGVVSQRQSSSNAGSPVSIGLHSLLDFPEAQQVSSSSLAAGWLQDLNGGGTQ